MEAVTSARAAPWGVAPLEAAPTHKNLNWILACVVDQKSKSLTFAFRLGLSDGGDTVIRPLAWRTARDWTGHRPSTTFIWLIWSFIGSCNFIP